MRGSHLGVLIQGRSSGDALPKVFMPGMLTQGCPSTGPWPAHPPEATRLGAPTQGCPRTGGPPPAGTHPGMTDVAVGAPVGRREEPGSVTSPRVGGARRDPRPGRSRRQRGALKTTGQQSCPLPGPPPVPLPVPPPPRELPAPPGLEGHHAPGQVTAATRSGVQVRDPRGCGGTRRDVSAPPTGLRHPSVSPVPRATLRDGAEGSAPTAEQRNPVPGGALPGVSGGGWDGAGGTEPQPPPPRLQQPSGMEPQPRSRAGTPVLGGSAPPRSQALAGGGSGHPRPCRGEGDSFRWGWK